MNTAQRYPIHSSGNAGRCQDLRSLPCGGKRHKGFGFASFLIVKWSPPPIYARAQVATTGSQLPHRIPPQIDLGRIIATPLPEVSRFWYAGDPIARLGAVAGEGADVFTRW